jgi:hypothetical protein
MQPGNLFFGGGAGSTNLSPLVVVFLLIAIPLILFLPRNKAIIPFVVAFFTIPFAQVVVVGPLHFPVVRILILTGLIRAAFPVKDGKRKFAGGFNKIDQMVVLWALAAYIVVSAQWMQGQAMIKFTGDFLDSLGGYVAVRFLVSDREAVGNAMKGLAVVCVIQGVCMTSEHYTYHNVFAALGENEPTIREGHVRAEGALGTLFGGTFAGVLIPMFLSLWPEKKLRKVIYIGVAGATAMCLASHASTSISALGAGVLALCLWPIRKQMRLVRWGIVAILIGLHMVMHGPVWSLLEKIDLGGGSSSYHRYMLVDNCIRHFGDWWFLGTTHYGDWGFDMWDLCNQFVAVALTGGLISFVFFIMIYSRSFSMIGKARRRVSGDFSLEWNLWALGAVLFADIVASFGINYMIQLQTELFISLACVTVVAFNAGKEKARSVASRETAMPSPQVSLAGANLQIAPEHQRTGT